MKKRFFLQSALPALLILTLVLPTSYALFVPQKTEASIACLGKLFGIGEGVASAISGALSVPVSNTTIEQKSISTASNTGASLFKECVLDPLVTVIVTSMIRNIGASVVDWINNGFKGSPAFLTDPAGFFGDVADNTIGDFIGGTELGFLCSPFQLDIRIALAQGYQPYRRKAACTLTDIKNNVVGFANGNQVGSWSDWLSRTIEPQNNPYGAYVQAQNELSIRIATAQGHELKLLDFGHGFLSFKTCDAYETGSTGNANDYSAYTGTVPQSGNNIYTGGTATATGQVGATRTASAGAVTPKCKPGHETIKTPGDVIANRLTGALGNEDIHLAAADEINEVIGAMANQLATQVLRGAQGLLGTSKKAPGGGKSYLETYQYSNYKQAFDDNKSSDQQAIDGIFDPYMKQLDDSLAGVGAGDTANLEVNVAIGKTASQSSQYTSFGPQYAVDGDTRGVAGGGAGVSITDFEVKPWWEVDLGSMTPIKTVEVYRRTNTTDVNELNTLGNFEVTVRDDNQNIVFISNSLKALASSPLTSVPVDTTGRYVRIARTETTPNKLQLGEVKVFKVGTNSTNSSTSTQGLTITVSPANINRGQIGITPQYQSNVNSLPTVASGNISFVSQGSLTNGSILLTLYKDATPVKFDTIFSNFTLTQSTPQSGQSTVSLPGAGSSASYTLIPSLSLNKNERYTVAYGGTFSPFASSLRVNYIDATRLGDYRLETVVRDREGNVLKAQNVTFNLH